MSASNDGGKNGSDIKRPGVLRSGAMISFDANWPDGVAGTGSVPEGFYDLDG